MVLINSDRCRLRPGSLVRFEQIVGRLSAAAAESGYERPWTAYQSLYGRAGNISFVTAHETWASLGQQAPPAKLFEDVLGQSDGPKLFEEANACIEELESVVAMSRPELSHSDPTPEQPAPFMQFTQMQARPGAQEECEELIRRVAEAIPKIDDPTRFTAWQTMLGDRLTYGVSFPLTSLAELDDRRSPPELLEQAFGHAEGGLIYRQGREAIGRLETSISVYRQDLSNPGA